VRAAFAQEGLNWRDYVEQDAALFRPTDLVVGRADPSRAYRELGWKATTTGIDVVKKMYELI
jgi:GDPmannose 4,6-dehydratase